MLRAPHLDDLPQIALLRSADIAKLLSGNLARLDNRFESPSKMEELIRNCLHQTVFRPYVNQLRKDDAVNAAGEIFDECRGERDHLYKLDFLGDMAERYLYRTGGGVEAKRQELIRYCEVIRDIHPALLIGMFHVMQLERREVDVEAIAEGLSGQCPLAFPAGDPGRPYADNHVHLNGVGMTSHPLMALAAGYARVGSEPKVALDPALGIGGDFGVVHLDKMLKAATAYLVGHASGEAKAGLVTEQRNLLGTSAPLKKLSGQVLVERLSRVPRAPVPRQLAMHLGQSLVRSDAGAAMHFLVILALWLYRNGDADYRLRLSVLAFIHSLNLIRSAIVMAGTGLGTFVEYYRSKLRKHGTEDFAEADRWPTLIGNGNDMAEAKLGDGDADPQSLLRLAQKAARARRTSRSIQVAPDACRRYHLSFHFIRKRETKARKADVLVRFGAERRAVEASARKLRRALATVVKAYVGGGNIQNLMTWVRSFDVAGDETRTPIEVFAPSMRWLRDKPLIQNVRGSRVSPRRAFSVHAGEDFSCLAHGLRHVDETLRFCGLGADDRIGHGLALGFDPHQWAARQGLSIVPLQTHVDNLVWLWHHAMELAGRVDVAARALPGIQRRLEQFAHELFDGAPPSIEVLFRAWLLRRNCPFRMVFEKTPRGRPDARYWIPDLYEKPDLVDTLEFKEFCRYHSIGRAGGVVNQHANKKVRIKLGEGAEREVNPARLRDGFGTAELGLMEVLQDYLLDRIDQLGVVIEACPTSNLYIARLHGYHEHPIFRWRPLDEASLAPGGGANKYGLRRGPVQVCLNTDDPAVFPTSIAAEHFLLKEAAVRDHGASRAAAEDWIDRIRVVGVELFRRSNAQTEFLAAYRGGAVPRPLP